MKKLWIFFALLIVGGQFCAAQDKAAKNVLQAQVERNNKFAIELFGKLSKPGENLFFSPYSISQAMGMAYAGARGNTAAEIAQTMGFDKAPQEAMSQIASKINSSTGENLVEIANSFWAQQNANFLPEFLKTLQTSYFAEAYKADFSQSAKSAAEINGWVSKKTRDMIPGIVSPSDISLATKLILVNAIYFEGIWQNKFKKKDTNPAVFFGSKGDFQLPFMFAHDFCLYGKTDGVQVLSKPYKGGNFALQILLPKEKNGLPKLEKSLTAKKLEKLTAKLTDTDLELYLPKYKAESSFSLSDYLRALGIKDAFSFPQADFSGMDGKKDLFISKVLHKASVAVDEEGTKAAAATAVIMTLGAIMEPEPPVVFRADHPFIYIIRHVPTNAILFMGKFGEEKSGSVGAPAQE